MDYLATNLAKLQARIEETCKKVNRSPKEVTILAASKYANDDAIDRLFELGITTFGENRIQDARTRIERFPQIEWHFIGSLQTNKVKYCQEFNLIHSLDRYRLAQALNEQGQKWDKVFNVLMQINISGEDTKHGIEPEAALDFAGQVQKEFPNLKLCGLMTMAPYGQPEDSRPIFKSLRCLRDEIAKELAIPLDVLSMGMSNDFEVAIEEGATIIRVGSALFSKEG